MSRLLEQLGSRSPFGKISGIQYSIFSPDMIRDGSVCEVIYPDTYENGEPKMGGLFDLRMGVIDYGRDCLSCENTLELCPGHFGHIDLALPVFNINYIDQIIKIMRLTCFRCSKLLFDKNDPKLLAKIVNLTGIDRFNMIYTLNRTSTKLNQCKYNEGCFIYQPSKYRKIVNDKNKYAKDDVLKIVGEFKDEAMKDANIAKNQVFTSDICYEILRRISKEDCEFLGFSNEYSRPEWMIWTVFPVAPPAVRPSVKHGNEQRAEDDLTYEYANIVKANNQTKQKLLKNANATTIAHYRGFLQYHVVTIINNSVPGIPPSAQRSGRPLKSITQRLLAKGGRMRGNLSGKRVDNSARSVISVDPNLNIDQLRVPKVMAKNLTRKVKVTRFNKKKLVAMVRNGPNVYPGANRVKLVNGSYAGERGGMKSLKYIDVSKLKLEIGDEVHRHLLDGDPVLFNRQPSLHKMSMMAHKIVVSEGKTFGFNVTGCKPYNADFDGDEMNMHNPQSYQTSAELQYIASVPNHIISPSKSAPILGLVQDSLIGAYLMTNDNTRVTKQQFYNYLMFDKSFDGNLPESPVENKLYTGKQLFSKILPNISLRRDNNTGEKVVVKNGELLQGRFDKKILGATAGGLIQFTYNQYGVNVCQNLLDYSQLLILRWMETAGFSLGYGDGVVKPEVYEMIQESIGKKVKEANDLIIKAQQGTYEPSLDIKYRRSSFETDIMSILGDMTKVEDILKNDISSTNNIKRAIDSGSKGDKQNIKQIMGLVGQQSIMGRRVTEGFTKRTLPHFYKNDNSPAARGFVANSYMKGLTPDEMFFHTMSGRVGMIDTAIKTADSGYIQRRLVKALEDMKVCYDQTVRNARGTIVQFSYGSDGMDPIRLEKQKIFIIGYDNLEMHRQYYLDPKEYKVTKEEEKLILDEFQQLMEDRDALRYQYKKNAFQQNVEFLSPANVHRLISVVKDKFGIESYHETDLEPTTVIRAVRELIAEIQELYVESDEAMFLKIMIRATISAKKCVEQYRLNKVALEFLLLTIKNKVKRSFIQAGDLVGIVGAQSIGEILTQMTLNTFHLAGVGGKSVITTSGVPRLEEIINYTVKIKTPSMSIYLNNGQGYEMNNALKLKNNLEYTTLKDILLGDGGEIIHTGNQEMSDEEVEYLKLYEEFSEMLEIPYDRCNIQSPWILKFVFDKTKMMSRSILITDVRDSINRSIKDASQIDCIISDDNSATMAIKIKIPHDDKNFIDKFERELLKKPIKGIEGIVKPGISKMFSYSFNADGSVSDKEEWVIGTNGSNMLKILNREDIDISKTTTNDLHEIYNLFGIEAVRSAIIRELTDTISADNYVNPRHISLLADAMTVNGIVMQITRNGMNNNVDSEPIGKASYERIQDVLIKASIFAQTDSMKGVSANVVFGQMARSGTNMFDVVLDEDKLLDLAPRKEQAPSLKSPGDIMDSLEEVTKRYNVTENSFNFGFIFNLPRYNLSTRRFMPVTLIVPGLKTNTTQKTTKTTKTTKKKIKINKKEPAKKKIVLKKKKIVLKKKKA